MKLDQASPAGAEPLSCAQPGAMFDVFRIDAVDTDAVRLKRMGICVGRRIQLIQAGDPLILRVVGCRVGVSRRLASLILVGRSVEDEG